MRKQPADTQAQPLAIGTGLVALDVVVSEGRPESPSHWAGGTCGNVLAVLRYLGWQAAPIARLRDGRAARQLLADFRHWGVSTEFISLREDGSTPIIVHWIRKARGGEPRHSFSWRCPNCGSRLPGYKPVLAKDAEDLSRRLDSPSVFIFDRLSRGALILARHCAKRGAAVIFEPSTVGNPILFKEAWELADVVKYSHERLLDVPDEMEASAGPWLRIETLGQDGLRYRLRAAGSRARGWQSLDALPAPRVRDTAGAGDWCTAGILHKLFPAGVREPEPAEDARVRAAIRYGQALAAWTCGFEGARAAMYEAGKLQFEREVAALLGEPAGGGAAARSRQAAVPNGMACFCPSCEPPTRIPVRIRKAGGSPTVPVRHERQLV